MSLIEAFRFTTRLQGLTTLAACSELFREAILPYGFDTFACGELDMDNRTRNAFYIIGWPEAWTKFYVGSGLIHRDPLVDELAHRHEPFTWSDLRADKKLHKIGRAALAAVAAAGWNEGLVVPVPRGVKRVGLVSLVGHRDDLDAQALAHLCLISLALHSHARTLVSREGFAVPPAGLTSREIECLALVAEGMSDKSIADRLGIAMSTAHEHVENAKRRLGVRSRVHMVAIAAALGVIDI
jgi:DNA-binding CsgD family transcriptional regulator